MAQGKDIFGYSRASKPQGVFSTENSRMVFGDQKDPTGYLVQNWNIAYNQDVIEVFELGSNNLYWTKGRPVGTGQVARIIGFKDAEAGQESGAFFPQSAYDICDGGALMALTVVGGHCTSPVKGTPINGSFQNLGTANKGVIITMDGCVITSLGFSANVADTRLVEQVAWRFAFMDVATTTA